MLQAKLKLAHAEPGGGDLRHEGEAEGRAAGRERKSVLLHGQREDQGDTLKLTCKTTKAERSRGWRSRKYRDELPTHEAGDLIKEAEAIMKPTLRSLAHKP